MNFKGQKTKSAVQKQTLNPMWSRKLIELGGVKEGETELLEISLFDHDLVNSDDFMGIVRVTAGELHALGHGERKFWFKLNKPDDERYRNEAVSGEILVEISVKVTDLLFFDFRSRCDYLCAVRRNLTFRAAVFRSDHAVHLSEAL